jgi:Xaa-Pro aminopeptidase
LDIERSAGLWEPLSSDEQHINRAREKGATFTLRSARDILTEFGRSRSPSEIELIRKAVDITAQAQLASWRTVQPGLYEYQVQGLIEYVFTMNGAQRSAFASIIGSGPNSCVLHWMKNSRQMQAGDLVVIDIGALYKLYSSDITRTIPVSGRFTPRQKEIYEIVLMANTAAIDMVAPGIHFDAISRRAADIIGEGLVKLGLIEDKKDYRKYYFHGLGHAIGLGVGGRAGLGILEPGMVLTIEPGIYISEEGLGVRIEDDVLVTETGHEVLSKRVPKTVAAIEKVMREKGIDHSKYLVVK